jgi:hypothetical protein
MHRGITACFIQMTKHNKQFHSVYCVFMVKCISIVNKCHSYFIPLSQTFQSLETIIRAFNFFKYGILYVQKSLITTYCAIDVQKTQVFFNFFLVTQLQGITGQVRELPWYLDTALILALPVH